MIQKFSMPKTFRVNLKIFYFSNCIILFFLIITNSCLSISLAHASELTSIKEIDPRIASFAWPTSTKPRADGLYGANRGKGRWLAVDYQAGAMTSLVGATINNETETFPLWISAASLAFDYLEPNGDFHYAPDAPTITGPADHGTHDAMFLGAFAEALLVLSDSSSRKFELAELLRFRSAISKAIGFLSRPEQIEDMWATDTIALNRACGYGKALILGGTLLQDTRAKLLGTEIIRRVISLQAPAGYFPEHHGYDASYHAVTLSCLDIVSFYTDIDGLRPSIEHGTRWLLSRFDSSGHLLQEGDTRTRGQEHYFDKVKEVDWRAVVRSLALSGIITHNEDANNVANKVLHSLGR